MPIEPSSNSADAGRIFGAQSTMRASLLFALTFALIPNLGFLLASIFFVPERIVVAPFYLGVGLLALFVPVPVTALLLVSVAALDVLVLVCKIFFLSPSLAFSSIGFLTELDPLASLLYIGFALTMAATVALMVWMTARYRTEFRQARLVPAVLALLAVIGIDGAVNKTFGMFAPNARVPSFDSAFRRSGIAEGPAAHGERNLLMVVVEGFGALADPTHRAIFDAEIFTPDVMRRFDVASGTSPYYGSTTGAESRELCGRWGDYRNYQEGGPHDCLPNRLRAEGVETVAVHGFAATMFNRHVWYPKVGFDRFIDAEALAADYADKLPSQCGLTFRSFCDREVGEIVHQLAVEPTQGRRFTYWLTLNTHVPFEPEAATAHLDCADGGGPFGEEGVCNLSEMWLEVFQVVERIATDPNLPPTDILIVGDHNTPIFQRAGRDLFLREEVGWWALKDRTEPADAIAQAPVPVLRGTVR